MAKDFQAIKTAIEIAIRLSVLAILVGICYLILRPFLPLVVWAAIIAIALFKPFVKLESALGGRRKLAVTVFILIGLAIILVPSVIFFDSIFHTATSTSLRDGTLEISPPTDSVRDWPVVGERVYTAWHSASANLTQFIQEHRDRLSGITRTLAGMASGFILTILQFVASTIIAGILLGKHEAVAKAMSQLFRRLVGEDRGDEMITLSSSTVRSVAVGILGIALIQAVLGGLGMVLAGVPAAGLLAIIILVLAIAQLPPLVVLLPVIFYVSAHQPPTVIIIFTIWSIFVSFSDAILKPLFLGRGVKAPMLVILLGAIGGMMSGGIVGLFVGAVILALAYNLFIQWQNLDQHDTASALPDTQEAP